MDVPTRFLNVGQAAAYLGVSAASLRTWSNRGLVPTYRTPGGQRRYDVEDLDAFMRSMREPVSAENGGDGAGETDRERWEREARTGDEEPIGAGRRPVSTGRRVPTPRAEES